MPQQWLVKRPQEAGTPVTPPAVILPNAILGTPVVTTGYGTDSNNQLLIDITIGITWLDNNWGAVDRLKVLLYAPDNMVDSQEAFVGGPGGAETPGIVIADSTSTEDAAHASKVMAIDSPALMVQPDWNADRPYVHFSYPAPTAPEWWRVIVISASKTAENPAATSPWVRVPVTPQGPDVHGVEYAPLGLDFHLIDPKTGAITDQPYYDVIEGGAPAWGFSCTWQNDAKDPRYPMLGGYDIEIVYPGGSRETHAAKSSNDTRHDSPLWVFGAPGRFGVFLISYGSQQGNPRNSLIPGLTPGATFDVGAPVGPPGQERAKNVVNFVLANSWYGKNGAGQKTLFLDFRWTKPADDRAFGGVILVMIRGGQSYPLTGLETDTEQICELAQFPAASESVIVYAKSVSVSGDVNEYLAGYPGDSEATPAVSFTLVPPANNLEDVSGITWAVNYVKDEFGANHYFFSGSWETPNKALFPEFQGVKIYFIRKNAQGAITEQILLTGVETGSSFKTTPYPTPAAITGGYLVFATVDVNGVEKSIALSPQKEVFIQPQAGTLKNESLPDLDVANFAAGIEPVTFVNQAPSEVDGTLVGHAKQTTVVFNNNDRRLYRWNDLLDPPRYKVTGSALDIVADTITAGLIATGAIRTEHLAANEILVGPKHPTSEQVTGTQRPPILKVINWTGLNNSEKMVGFFGTYAPSGIAWEGIYALNLKIGPEYANPVLEASATGLLIRGTSATNQNVTFEMIDASNNSIRMSPIVFAPTYNSLGLKAASDPAIYPFNECWHVSRGFVGFERVSAGDPSARKIFALARNPYYRAGELVIYGPEAAENIRVLITGVDENDMAQRAKGIVRADRFDCANKPGHTHAGLLTVIKPGGLSVSLEINGGIITNVTHNPF